MKEKISKFILKHKDAAIDEIFFYYTGHGDFRGNEFYYILSDFDERNYRQTSLSNSELDNLLRQLSPSLAVKVIDACHSGVTYIKDNRTFSKHLNESKERFASCYFMFSYMSDQSSCQSDIISHFTKSFIDSIIKYPLAEIRYKHIIDSISDDFETNARQQPLFVTQASFTEVFCFSNQEMKSLLSKQMSTLLNEANEDGDLKAPTLVELIKEDAKRYCSEEEVTAIFDFIRNLVNGYEYSPEMKDMYEITTEIGGDKKSSFNGSYLIGKWLNENEHDYFAKATYRQQLRSEVSPISSMIASLSTLHNKESEYECIVSGFESKVEIPYKTIKIDSRPHYPNLDWHQCIITFVFSQVRIRFFYLYSKYRLSSWDNYSHDSSSDWQTIEAEMKDSEKLKDAISGILDKFESFVMDPLRSKYILTVESHEVADEK